MGDKVRIDKWLWSIRIFKSRTMATDAAKSGKVRIGEKALKPSALIDVEDHITVRKNGFEFQFKVDKLISKRVSATLAQECYTDLTPEEELNKYQSWFIGKARAEFREKGAGRPTKRERRTIDGFKEEQEFEYYDFDDSE